MSSSKFEEFLNKVTSKVKSKEAHNMIKKELTNHLEELSQSFQKRQSSKEDAEEKAIKAMGNPFTIGEKLNRLHKPKMDWVLIGLFIILACISFLPLVGGINQLSVNSSFFMKRQAIWYTIAVLAMISFLFFDYRKLKNWWMYFYGSGLILLLYTSGFGTMINGTQRWISISGINIDATMITLFFFFLAWAGLFTKVNEFNNGIKQGILFLLFWIPILLYVMLSQFMIIIIYFFCVITMFAFSRADKKLVIKLVSAKVLTGLILLGTIIITNRGGYLFNRLLAFIDPYADPSGTGYVYIVVRDVLSQAGWFGKGLYNDINIFYAGHTDFAFPYLVYSLGWTFGIALCLVLLIFIVRISKNAFKTKDLYGRLLVIGGATLFAVPAGWNILMGFGIVPIMGVSLPFISYGGSMLLFYSVILGLILNVFRRKDIIEPTIMNFE